MAVSSDFSCTLNRSRAFFPFLNPGEMNAESAFLVIGDVSVLKALEQ